MWGITIKFNRKPSKLKDFFKDMGLVRGWAVILILIMVTMGYINLGFLSKYSTGFFVNIGEAINPDVMEVV